jgi:hypothetical protein
MNDSLVKFISEKTSLDFEDIKHDLKLIKAIRLKNGPESCWCGEEVPVFYEIAYFARPYMNCTMTAHLCWDCLKELETLSAAVRNLEELIEEPMNAVGTELATIALEAGVINSWVFDFCQNVRFRGPEILSPKRFAKRAEQNHKIIKHYYPNALQEFSENLQNVREFYDEGRRFE